MRKKMYNIVNPGDKNSEINRECYGSGYTIMPNIIFQDHRITKTSKIIYLALRTFHRAGDNPVVWPSIDSLSKRSGCSEQTTRTALRGLEKNGLIKIEFQEGRSSKYRFIDFRTVYCDNNTDRFSDETLEMFEKSGSKRLVDAIKKLREKGESVTIEQFNHLSADCENETDESTGEDMDSRHKETVGQIFEYAEKRNKAIDKRNRNKVETIAEKRHEEKCDRKKHGFSTNDVFLFYEKKMSEHYPDTKIYRFNPQTVNELNIFIKDLEQSEVEELINISILHWQKLRSIIYSMKMLNVPDVRYVIRNAQEIMERFRKNDFNKSYVTDKREQAIIACNSDTRSSVVQALLDKERKKEEMRKNQ